MNTAMLYGIVSGITFGIVLAMLLLAISNKDNKIKTEYDERQQQVRGKGFRYGFFTMMGGIIIMMIIKSADVPIPVHDAVLLFLVMIIGVAEYVTYAILHDAYFGLNNKINSYLVIFAGIAVINAAVTIINAVSGSLIVDGTLGIGGINMLCSAMFVWMFIVLLIKKITDEKED